MSRKYYNHAFTVAFEVRNSTSEDGEDITDEMYFHALVKRAVQLLEEGAFYEATDAPYDTYEQEGLEGW